jgi:phospholipid/cholesterol/gamma-HCH transport system substrate-binding protein
MRHRTLFIAFLILAAIAGVAVAAIHLHASRGPVIYAELAAAPGVREGARVTFRGVAVGSVTRIAFVPDRVRLTIALDRSDVPLRQADSVRIKPDGILGDMSVVIVPGTGSAPAASDGAVLHEAAPDAASIRQQALGDALLRQFRSGLTNDRVDSTTRPGATP